MGNSNPPTCIQCLQFEIWDNSPNATLRSAFSWKFFVKKIAIKNSNKKSEIFREIFFSFFFFDIGVLQPI
jgi:hypothetical protein